MSDEADNPYAAPRRVDENRPRKASRLSRIAFFVSVIPLVIGLIYFWICAALGQSYRYDETLVGLPSLYCTFVATPLAAVSILLERNSWSRLAVVAVIADWYLLLPMVM